MNTNKLSFEWDMFSEDRYNEMKKELPNDYVGAVYIGDISIDILYDTTDNMLMFDFYVLGEDTGYGYTLKSDTPYDYADGIGLKLDVFTNMSYEEFRLYVEPLFVEHICKYDNGKYSLLEHAKKPVARWE